MLLHRYFPCRSSSSTGAEMGTPRDVPVVTGPENQILLVSPLMEWNARSRKHWCSDDWQLVVCKQGTNLMAELENRSHIKRVVPDAPHEALLALDASTGQNALGASQEFSKLHLWQELYWPRPMERLEVGSPGDPVKSWHESEVDCFGEKIDDIGPFHQKTSWEAFLKGLIYRIERQIVGRTICLFVSLLSKPPEGGFPYPLGFRSNPAWLRIRKEIIDAVNPWIRNLYS